MQPTAPSSIHINPKFRNIHINPMFLNKTINSSVPHPSPPQPTTNIYINPRFLNNPIILQNTRIEPAFDDHFDDHEADGMDIDHNEPEMVIAQIYTNTSRKLVRKPALPPSSTVPSSPLTKPSATQTPTMEKSRLLKIGSRKLIRSQPPRPKPLRIANAKVIRKPIQTKYKIVKEQTTYKIDRRSIQSKLSPVKRLSLTRNWLGINESLTPRKVMVTNFKLLKTHNENLMTPSAGTTSTSVFANRKMAFISINGIVYKSTNTKLQKTPAPSIGNAIKSTTASSPNSISAFANGSKLSNYRTLFVRGEKFLLDPSGRSLRRTTTSTTSTNSSTMVNKSSLLSRIDIGGLTYVQKSNNTFERTDFHKNRFHLNVAKQRSINVLSQNLVKTNVPCPVYKKLGKCAAFKRSKCTKLHDPKFVDICPKFLKDACDKIDCLLYHEKTLAKLPTCRFFLQGICVKNDCPYLHKKVNENTSICSEFLRGYCELAAKCPKRHDLLCPEYARKGECTVTRCPYPHPRRKKSKQTHMETDEQRRRKSEAGTMRSSPSASNNATPTLSSQPRTIQRYFIEDRIGDGTAASETSDDTKLSAEGKAKLSRVLNKIEQMKVNYNNLGSDTQTMPSQQSASGSSANGCTTVNIDAENEDDTATYRRKRPKLGKLPSFIPID